MPDGRLADAASLDVPPTIREAFGERKFDGTFSRDDVSLLWRVAARTDSRIEPIPCGVCQWHEDRSNAIIEIARRREAREVREAHWVRPAHCVTRPQRTSACLAPSA